jgi:hypothetical protein
MKGGGADHDVSLQRAQNAVNLRGIGDVDFTARQWQNRNLLTREYSAKVSS